MTEKCEANALSEQELVTRMLANDNQAWREFVRRYRPLLLDAIDKVLRRFRNACTRADNEDVYATILSGLYWQNMRKLRGFDFARGYRLSNWLLVLARNAAWDHLRTTVRKRDAFSTFHETDLVIQADDASRELI